MRAAGDRAAAHQRGEFVTLFHFKARLRRLAFLTHANDTLPTLQNILQQRGLDHFGMRLPLAAHQRQVVFLHAFIAQLLVQRTQRRALFRHQQHAGGIAVETMHQLKETCLRAQGAQPFNHAKAQSAAAVYRSTGRFVEYQNMIVFIEDHLRERGHFLQMRRYRLFFTLRHAHRRDTDFITRFQLILRLHALFVYPHLAFTQDAINHALRYTFQLGTQKVVDTLPRFISSNGNHFYGWGLSFHGARF